MDTELMMKEKNKEQRMKTRRFRDQMPWPYKTLSSLGRKLMFSYGIVILVLTSVFLLFSSLAIGNELDEQTKNDLAKDADTISKQITMAIDYQLNNSSGSYPFENQITIRQKIFSDYSLGISEVIIPRSRAFSENRLATTHIIVLDKEKKPIYQSYNPDLSTIDIENIDKDKYFVEKRELRSSDSSVPMGYLIMLAIKADLSSVSKLINQTLLIAIIIAGVSAIIIGFLLENKFLKPIKILRKNIQNFSLNESYESWQKVESNDELSAINDDFIKMAKKMRVNDQRQKRFFQNTSHELKTPLMSIQGYAEAIKDNVIETDAIEEALEIIIDESKKLKNALNSVVYLSQLPNDAEEETQPIQVWGVIENFFTRMKGVHQDKFITIHNEIRRDFTIQANEEKLDRLFTNILTNALRHTNETIWIRHDLENDKCILIEDDGQGFETQALDQVFDRFYKGKGGNTGLGLSIVQEITELYHWTVAAYNVKEKGAGIRVCFYKGQESNDNFSTFT